MTRHVLPVVALVIAGLLPGCAPRAQPTPVPAPTPAPAPAPLVSPAAPAWQVYFSPEGGAQDALVAQISAAQRQVLVQAYSFTSIPIEKALVEAKQRGVDVQVILDSRWEKNYPVAMKALIAGGVPVFLDGAHPIAHNKVCVVDGATVCTGSFNYTRQAEKSNAENLLVIHDRELAAQYAVNWKIHYSHSDPAK